MKRTALFIALLMLTVHLDASAKVYRLADYGVTPDADRLAERINDALLQIKTDAAGKSAVVRMEKGVYYLSPDDAPVKVYYISNHDQVVNHATGIALEGWQNLTLDGAGSKLLCTGRMLPMSIVQCRNVKVKNLSIDFDNPQIAQVTITESGAAGITFRPSREVDWRLDDKGRFVAQGKGWSIAYPSGIAFDGATRHIVPQTSDLVINFTGCELRGDAIHAPNWVNARLKPGTVVALRNYERPNPAIFMEADQQTALRNINIHYAEGMGVVAQRCTDIHLNSVNVCIEAGSERYFTTQADATHFVQCRGKIVEENSLYEAMMDDAINVHGVYLRVRERIDEHTLRCRFEHNQAFGYAWGDVGDKVAFIRSATMDQLSGENTIRSIQPASGRLAGTKEFIIKFEEPVPAAVSELEGYGVENLTWTPEVVFRKCVVRNNRARGALFSSPLRTVCEGNVFDHTSGTAILLCGDCNGWYESGAVRNLIIRKNKFINALTNMFQFTNAVISIYPEVPRLAYSQNYFHGGTADAIRIENNYFETFDSPLVYAKSVDGLVVKGNTVKYNHDFEPFHWNTQPVLLEHCTRTTVQSFPPRR